MTTRVEHIGQHVKQGRRSQAFKVNVYPNCSRSVRMEPAMTNAQRFVAYSFLALLTWVVGTGCAANAAPQDDDASSSIGGKGGSLAASNSSSSGKGGTSNGSGGTGGTSSSGMPLPCGIDCSSIATDDCHQGQCNTETKQCEIVSVDDGTSCDDGLFCTVNETCTAGLCEGGELNTCGNSPGACDEVTCDEMAKACGTTPKGDGAPCASSDLCQVNATCSNGLCTGIVKDCFFSPVPNDCHSAVCNPMNGLCEPQIDTSKDGTICSDPTALCTVDKTCNNGMCEGGKPKDCSQLTQGCVLGACDSMTGSCVAQALKNGDPCDDFNACTSGETCNNGGCSGGSPVTMCMPGDNCCPMGCTVNNDVDCAIAFLDVGPYSNTYSSSSGTRGYWFTAPVSFTIKGLRVPTDVGTEPQNIQVVSFPGGAPPSYPTSTTSHTTLAYHKAVPGTDWINMNIPVTQGDVIGILGARGTSVMKNSYGASGYSSMVNGQAMMLNRLIYQANVHNAAAGALSGNTGPIARVEMKYTP